VLMVLRGPDEFPKRLLSMCLGNEYIA
jgi:hypothetical protein